MLCDKKNNCSAHKSHNKATCRIWAQMGKFKSPCSNPSFSARVRLWKPRSCAIFRAFVLSWFCVWSLFGLYSSALLLFVNVNEFATASLAPACASMKGWAYMFIVVLACACPRHACTVFTSTPLEISKLAFKCLKLWIFTYLIISRSQNRLSHDSGACGDSGDPSAVLKTNSFFCHASKSLVSSPA